MAGQLKVQLSTDEIGAITRALADPRRFAILQQIAKSETMACSALEEKGCLSPATISHHLKELTEAGLIEVAREGRCARMTLRRDTWDAYLDRLSQL